MPRNNVQILQPYLSRMLTKRPMARKTIRMISILKTASYERKLKAGSCLAGKKTDHGVQIFHRL